MESQPKHTARVPSATATMRFIHTTHNDRDTLQVKQQHLNNVSAAYKLHFKTGSM